ncbi:MAG: hypothetical protein ING25_11920 [Burkholderiales bacterium]|nr:hypothetical protein [Burkholderiales bacterium]
MYKFTKLTRNQLAKFLPDHESIKVFEQITANAGELLPDQIYQLMLDTGIAQSNANAALDSLNRIAQALELLATAPPEARVSDDAALLLPPPQPEKRKRYGTFYDTTTQVAAAINTAYAVTFNSTDLSQGVYRGATTSRIYVDEPGVYDFQFSAQLDNTSGGNHLVFIWCRINGVDVANSASQVRLKGTDGELVAAWNFVLSMKDGDYFELMYSVSDTAAQIVAQAAAAPVPAIPSVILTVTNNIS